MKAKERLESATVAFESFKTVTSFAEFKRAWTAYLLAANSIYSSLEQGAKDNPKSRQWFGREKKKRREDPLLQYLHQARNSDEHGLEPIVAHRNGSLSIGSAGESVHIEHLTMRDGQISMKLKPVDGKVPSITITHPHAALVTVRDSRYGNTYDPPIEHLGEPLEINSPGRVAELGLAYHRHLIGEAEKLAP